MIGQRTAEIHELEARAAELDAEIEWLRAEAERLEAANAWLRHRIEQRSQLSAPKNPKA